MFSTRVKNNTVNSYGVICYRILPDGKIQYLLVQRKHSISYIEFLRGKYSLRADGCLNYISHLLFTMTGQERNNLLLQSFDELWKELWMHRNEPKLRLTISDRHQNEYNLAKEKYEQIKRGKVIRLSSGKDKLITLKNLLSLNYPDFHSLEWGFPKGRRDRGETALKTAIREFVEETNYQQSHIQVFTELNPYKEIFVGSNNQVYCYIYYLAKLEESNNSIYGGQLNRRNYSQITEIGNIGWFSIDEANKKISNLFLQRIGILEKLDLLLKEQMKTLTIVKDSQNDS